MADESQYRLRIPADLKAKLEAAAKESGRSMNAQVLYTLEMALTQESDLEALKGRADEHEEWLKEIDKRLDRVGRNMDIVAEYAGVPNVRDMK